MNSQSWKKTITIGKMNNAWVKYLLVFLLVVMLQGMVVNNFEINEYFNPMIYPIMIILLPFEISTIAGMIIALLLGLSVDAFSNTFGLHASSALLIGYLRPTIMRYLRPRDGYDSSLLPTVHDMGLFWIIGFAGVLTFVHHLWFFSFEIFRFDLIFIILLKTLSSALISLPLIILFQYIFYKPSKA